uniref:Uncharacterized protein n=1 Tax=Glossina palpalis gambiensis TaxID=67801 RepID=A0A1B0BC01_9MUSC
MIATVSRQFEANEQGGGNDQRVKNVDEEVKMSGQYDSRRWRVRVKSFGRLQFFLINFMKI